jgi:serine protease inhibitor
MKMVLNPDSMEEKVIGLWMPKFTVTTKLPLKSTLSRRPEMAEFFSEQADYSRMAKEQVQVHEVHHMVIILI